MDILVFGGTRFFGKQLVANLIDEGHRVTIATRGKTPDDFGNSIKRICIDRTDAPTLASILCNSEYDIVYDQICYAPNDALLAIDALQNRVGKYVFTSSMAVYHNGDDACTEDDFNPYTYPVRTGWRDQFSYAEGKRLAESIFFQESSFDVIAVRFPVVLGPNDYTRRIEFHLERIRERVPIRFDNVNAKTCFISSVEAGNFLNWIISTNIVGSFNACSSGVIRWRELFDIFEQVTGQEAVILKDTYNENVSPYNESGSRFMTSQKATECGFQFQSLLEWLPGLIRELAV